MSLNTGDQGYNNGKKYGQKGTLCGPNRKQENSINRCVETLEDMLAQ
jgi:hypothetical protein